MGWNHQALGVYSNVEDQYRDWERVSRPEVFGELGGDDVYTPVYVELKKGIDPQTIREKIEGGGYTNQIRFDDLGLRILGKLAGPGDPTKSIFRRFFIYVREKNICEEKLCAAEKDFDILYIGVPLPIPQDRRPDPAFENPLPFRDAGVVTAVIDDFIAIGHDRFMTNSKTTRIERFWSQRIPFSQLGNNNHPLAKIGFGTKYIKKQISDLLAYATKGGVLDEDQFFRCLYPDGALQNVRPPISLASTTAGPKLTANGAQLQQALYQRPYAFRSSHGTHVLDLAAGYNHADAPNNRPIFAVQVPQLATAETWGARLNHFILTALQQIMLWAEDAPCVVNLSYSVFAGAKDGTDFLASEMARLVNERNDAAYDAKAATTYLTLPSGNGYRASCHAHGTLTEDASVATFRWTTQPEDLSDNALELYMRDAPGATLDVTLPGETVAYTVPLDSERLHRFTVDGQDLAMIRVSEVPGQAVFMRALITLAPTLNYDKPDFAQMAGDCVLTLRGPAAYDGVERNYHMDVQRDDTPSTFPLIGRQSYLDRDEVYELDEVTGALDLPHAESPISRGGTLTPFAGHGATGPGSKFIAVVGGAREVSDAPGARPALYSAMGDERFRFAPSLSAYSDDTRQTQGRIAAGTSQGSVVAIAGTSVAAPQVARLIADKLGGNGGNPIPPAELDLVVHAGDDPRLGKMTLPLGPGQGRVARREA